MTIGGSAETIRAGASPIGPSALGGRDPFEAELFETERIVAEAMVAEAIISEAIISEANVSEPNVPESRAPEQFVLDPFEAEEFLAEEFVAEEFVAEEFVPEEFVAEEPVPGEFVPEAFVPEHFMPEELEPEDVVPETFVPQTSVPEPIVPEPIVDNVTTPAEQLDSLLARLDARLDALDERLANLERSTEDLRRRDLLWELRTDPSRLIAGIAEIRRVTPEDLDDLAEVLSRWDVPLSPAELKALQQTALIAQGVSGARGAKVHLVVNIVSRVTTSDIERITRTARILSSRSRRAIPILVSLHEPSSAITNVAIARGVEIALDE